MDKLTSWSPFLVVPLLLAGIAGLMFLPLEEMLLNLSLSDFEAEYVSLSLKMAVILMISTALIKNTRSEETSGLSSKHRWQNKYLNTIPIYLITIGGLNLINRDLSLIHLPNLGLLFMACMTVGFAEEFLFRGFIQSLFLRRFVSKKRGQFLAVLISSVFFGGFHLLNWVKADAFLPVLVQVIFATFIGFFFGVMVLKTNKIAPLAITHGLINFFFSLEFLPAFQSIGTPEASAGFSPAPILLTLPLFLIGLWVLRKLNPEETAQKIISPPRAVGNLPQPSPHS